MDKQNFMIRVANLIEELEKNGFEKEADKLHNEFMKVAAEGDIEKLYQSQLEEEKGTQSNIQTNGIGGMIGPGASLLGGAKSLFSKGMGKFGLLSAIMNFGVDYAVDFFEDAQGPYQLFKTHMPDIEKIINKINELVKDNEVRILTDNLRQMLKQCETELEEAKKQMKVASKVQYNHKTANTKLAIRGEYDSDYLRSLIRNVAQGAGVGAVLGIPGGAAGAGAGALIGGIGSLLGKGSMDIFYQTMSSTGKAYYQGKDLEQKITRLANTLDELSPELASNLKELVDQILSKLEEINLKNPNKSYFENILRHLEKKTVGQISNTFGNVKEKAIDIGNQAQNLAE